MLYALIILFALALFGLPLFTVLGAGSLFYAQQSGLDSALLIVELNRLATSPNLTAIPLFTLAGVVLAAGGAPQRLIRLFNAILGWLPGGLGIVAIVACAFFTSFSPGTDEGPLPRALHAGATNHLGLTGSVVSAQPGHSDVRYCGRRQYR
jgi:TRAP-type mannitol/chloroaromatic compound transport system permease large subunit